MGKFPGCRLFKALQTLSLLDCHVKFQHDWKREHCFTVDFEMTVHPLMKRPVEKPFRYVDAQGVEQACEGTHTHTGFPGCTEEQGYNQLCDSLERAAKVIENHRKSEAGS